MKGFIKDYRKEIESDIWMMPPLYHRVWQWLKYNVNHENKEIPMRDGSKMLIKRGQHLTSIRKIAKGVGWHERNVWKEPNPKTISTILKWLEKENNIQILGVLGSVTGNSENEKTVVTGNSAGTLITLVQWDVFNPKTVTCNAKVTGRGVTRDINKNDIKNDKNKDKDIYRKFEHLSMTHIEFERLIGEGFSKDQIDDILDRIENSASNTNYTSLLLTARNWMKRDKSKVSAMPQPKAEPAPKEELEFYANAYAQRVQQAQRANST